MVDQLQILWKYRWWLTAFTLLTLVAAVGLSLREAKSYEASARVRLIPSQQLADLSLPDPTGLDRFVETYAEVARSTAVIDAAARRIAARPKAAALEKSITVTTERSGVVRITAVAPDGRRAADYANGVAGAFIRHVRDVGDATRRSAVSRITQRMRRDASQLDRAKPRSGQARALLSELQQLSARLADTQARPSDQAQLMERATVPAVASSPRPIRSAVLALVFALFAGSALALGHSSLSDRFASATEAADELDLPLLGVVPRADPEDPAALDAFRVLRTSTRFALRRRNGQSVGVVAPQTVADNGATSGVADTEGSVILVTSPTAQCGKTHITAGLAAAFAADGERVIAVDADLRRPKLHERYNAPLEPGVADFLDGFCDFFSDARADSCLPSRRPTGSTAVARRGGFLELLPAGRPRQDSSEMLATGRMAELVRRMRWDFGVAVINSPPSLSVADAAVLARYADAVIVVIDSHRTRRRAAERAVHELRSVEAPLLGVVFNRVSKGDAHYGYGRGARSELDGDRVGASPPLSAAVD
jgi:capsular exopolysaccharide synthesis family protein